MSLKIKMLNVYRMPFTGCRSTAVHRMPFTVHGRQQTVRGRRIWTVQRQKNMPLIGKSHAHAPPPPYPHPPSSPPHESAAAWSALATEAVGRSPANELYTFFFGPTPFSTFLLEYLPLLITVFLPMLCVIFALLCKRTRKSVGFRKLHTVFNAARADVRLIKLMSATKIKEARAAFATGKKASPTKGRAEEETIRARAAASVQKPGGSPTPAYGYAYGSSTCNSSMAPCRSSPYYA